MLGCSGPVQPAPPAEPTGTVPVPWPSERIAHRIELSWQGEAPALARGLAALLEADLTERAGVVVESDLPAPIAHSEWIVAGARSTRLRLDVGEAARLEICGQWSGCRWLPEAPLEDDAGVAAATLGRAVAQELALTGQPPTQGWSLDAAQGLGRALASKNRPAALGRLGVERATAAWLLARASFEAGDQAGALAALLQAEALDPRRSIRADGAALATITGSSHAAERWAELVASPADRDPRWELHVARSLVADGQAARARALLSGLPGELRQDPAVAARLADLDPRRAPPPAAERPQRAVREALEGGVDSELPRDGAQRAAVLIERGRYAEAARLVEEPWATRLAALQRAGEARAALLEGDPAIPSRIARAHALLNAGDAAAARRVVDSILRDQPWEPDALGLRQRLARDRADAEDAWRRRYWADPSTPAPGPGLGVR